MKGDVETLDVGCGGGFWAIECFNRGNRVLGIDIGEDKIKAAHERLKRWRINSSRIIFKRIDIRRLRENKRYDQILCFEVLEHIMNDKEVIQKLSSLLESSGQLLISTPSKDSHPFYGEYVTSIENGGHVRKGYSFTDLERKLGKVGLEITITDSCGGFFTQKCLAFIRLLSDKLAKKVWLKYGLKAWLPLIFTSIIGFLLRPLTCLDILIPYPNHTIFVIARRKRNN